MFLNCFRPENGATGSDGSVRNKYDAFTPHINRQHLHNEQYTTPVQPSKFLRAWYSDGI